MRRHPIGTAGAGLALSAWLALAVVSPSTAAEPTPVALDSAPLASFRIGRPEDTRFDALEWVGGFEVTSPDRTVGGLSGLLVDPDGAGLLAITDDGLMLRATIRRDAVGRPIGFADGRLKRMTAADGASLTAKWDADTEALDRSGDRILISFEGRPRLMTGSLAADGFVGPLTPLPLPKAVEGLRFTKGLEALAVAPAEGPLAGATVILAERAERGAGTDDLPGWVLGSKPARFRVKRIGDYDITDARFGPDGDLYILERLYSLAEGVRARLRRIATATIVDGALLDGPVLLAANLSHQIDNMEGLDLWIAADGSTRVSLLSDDNRSFLQRTLYLEFRPAP